MTRPWSEFPFHRSGVVVTGVCPPSISSRPSIDDRSINPESSRTINDSEVSADQPIVDALARRALALDPSWERGSIHEFFVSWESGRSSIGGSKEAALDHYEKAVDLSEGLRASHT